MDIVIGSNIQSPLVRTLSKNRSKGTSFKHHIKDNVPPVSFSKVQLNPNLGAVGTYNMNYKFKIPQYGYWRDFVLKFSGADLPINGQVMQDILTSFSVDPIYNAGSADNSTSLNTDYFQASDALQQNYSLNYLFGDKRVVNSSGSLPGSSVWVPNGFVPPLEGNVRSGGQDPWAAMYLRVNGGYDYSSGTPTLQASKGQARIFPFRATVRWDAVSAYGRNMRGLFSKSINYSGITSGGYCDGLYNLGGAAIAGPTTYTKKIYTNPITFRTNMPTKPTQTLFCETGPYGADIVSGWGGTAQVVAAKSTTTVSNVAILKIKGVPTSLANLILDFGAGPWMKIGAELRCVGPSSSSNYTQGSNITSVVYSDPNDPGYTTITCNSSSLGNIVLGDVFNINIGPYKPVIGKVTSNMTSTTVVPTNVPYTGTANRDDRLLFLTGVQAGKMGNVLNYYATPGSITLSSVNLIGSLPSAGDLFVITNNFFSGETNNAGYETSITNFEFTSNSENVLINKYIRFLSGPCTLPYVNNWPQMSQIQSISGVGSGSTTINYFNSGSQLSGITSAGSNFGPRALLDIYEVCDIPPGVSFTTGAGSTVSSTNGTNISRPLNIGSVSSFVQHTLSTVPSGAPTYPQYDVLTLTDLNTVSTTGQFSGLYLTMISGNELGSAAFIGFSENLNPGTKYYLLHGIVVTGPGGTGIANGDNYLISNVPNNLDFFVFPSAILQSNEYNWRDVIPGDGSDWKVIPFSQNGSRSVFPYYYYVSTMASFTSTTLTLQAPLVNYTYNSNRTVIMSFTGGAGTNQYRYVAGYNPVTFTLTFACYDGTTAWPLTSTPAVGDGVVISPGLYDSQPGYVTGINSTLEAGFQCVLDLPVSAYGIAAFTEGNLSSPNAASETIAKITGNFDGANVRCFSMYAGYPGTPYSLFSGNVPSINDSFLFTTNHADATFSNGLYNYNYYTAAERASMVGLYLYFRNGPLIGQYFLVTACIQEADGGGAQRTKITVSGSLASLSNDGYIYDFSVSVPSGPPALSLVPVYTQSYGTPTTLDPYGTFQSQGNMQLANRYLGQRYASTYDWCSQSNLSRYLGALMPQQVTLSAHGKVIQTIYPPEIMARIYDMPMDKKKRLLGMIRPHLTSSPSSIGSTNTFNRPTAAAYNISRTWTCYFPCMFSFFEDISLNLDTRFVESLEVDVFVNPMTSIFDNMDLGIGSSNLGLTHTFGIRNDRCLALTGSSGYLSYDFRSRAPIVSSSLTVTGLSYFHNFHDKTSKSLRDYNFQPNVPTNLLCKNTFFESPATLTAQQVCQGSTVTINLACNNLVTDIVILVRRNQKNSIVPPTSTAWPVDVPNGATPASSAAQNAKNHHVFESFLTTLPIKKITLVGSGKVLYSASGHECMLTDVWDYAMSSIKVGSRGSNDSAIYADSLPSAFVQSKPRCDEFFAYKIPFGFSSDPTYNSGSVGMQTINNPTVTIELYPLHGWTLQDDNLAITRSSVFNLSEMLRVNERFQTVDDYDFQVEIYENYFQLLRIDSNTGTITKSLDL